MIKQLFLFSLLLFVSCTSKVADKVQEDAIEEFFSISASNVKDTTNIYIEDLVEQFEIVRLENAEEAYCQPLTMYITDHHIGITAGREAYKLFSRDGKFLCNVGAVGQGPGEYTSPLYHQIDEENKCIYLNTFNASKIMMYDFNGKFIKAIPLTNHLNNGSFKVDRDQGFVYCFDVPFGNKPFIWKQNLEGTILGEMKYYPYELRADYGNAVQTLYNTDFFYTSVTAGFEQLELKKDSLYHYYPQTNELKPIFSIDFGDKGQQYSYINTPLNFYVRLYIGRTDKNSQYTTARTELIKVDKQTHEGCYIKLFSQSYGSLPINLYYSQFRYGYFYTWMEPIELKEQLADVLESSPMDASIRSKVKKLHDGLSENDNNVLLIGKLKQKR